MICRIGASDRFWPILLKNSFSAGGEKFLSDIGNDARFKLEGYVGGFVSR